MNMDFMDSEFMIIYNYVELDFASVFVLDVQGPGPQTVTLLFHFLLRVGLLSSFVLLSPKPTPVSAEVRYQGEEIMSCRLNFLARPESAAAVFPIPPACRLQEGRRRACAVLAGTVSQVGAVPARRCCLRQLPSQSAVCVSLHSSAFRALRVSLHLRVSEGKDFTSSPHPSSSATGSFH